MFASRTFIAAGLALGVAVLSTSPVVAQDTALRADDLAYCHQLKALYERYMPTRAYGGSIGSSPSAATNVALSLCVPGRSAEAVAQLETVLRGAGYRLPVRSAIARQP
jgi:hypothetical protein